MAAKVAAAGLTVTDTYSLARAGDQGWIHRWALREIQRRDWPTVDWWGPPLPRVRAAGTNAPDLARLEHWAAMTGLAAADRPGPGRPSRSAIDRLPLMLELAVLVDVEQEPLVDVEHEPLGGAAAFIDDSAWRASGGSPGGYLPPFDRGALERTAYRRLRTGREAWRALGAWPWAVGDSARLPRSWWRSAAYELAAP
ncbi:MAG: hypothetical protein U0R70_06380 [Solirubrobacteraceae bacterium]